MAIQEGVPVETVHRGDRLAVSTEHGVKLRKVSDVKREPTGCRRKVHITADGMTGCYDMGTPVDLLAVGR